MSSATILLNVLRVKLKYNIQSNFDGSNPFGTMKICSTAVVRATEGYY